MIRKTIAFICCAAVALSALCLPAAGEQAVTVINGNELETFKGRTKEQLFALWQAAEVKEYDSIYETGKEASFSAPYSGGVIKQEVLDNVQSNLNYYRALTGSPQITERFVNQPELQNASVLQAINLRDRENGVGLTHTLWNYPKPDDMDEDFYDSAVHADHNIISTYGYHSSISGFFSESTFIYTAGHRTALLSPYIGSVQMGLGDTTYGRCPETTSASESFTEKFAAYPAPGYFPKQDHAVLSDWDIYLNLDYFKKADDNVTASITDLDTGEVFEYSYDNGNIRTGSVIFLEAPRKDENRYYAHNYRVEIFGLESISGENVSIEYTVNFYDKFESVVSPVRSVYYLSDINNTVFVGARTKDEAVKKITPLLPETVYARLESGSIVNAKIIGWEFSEPIYSYYPDASRAIICSPVVDRATVPKNVADPENFTMTLEILLGDETGYGFEQSSFEPVYGQKGESAEFNISVPMGSADYRWYKISKDLSVTALENGEKYQIDGSRLVITDLTKEDSGYYFVFASSDNWVNFARISDSVSLDVDGGLLTLGDADKNGIVNVTDALLILQCSVKKLSFDQSAQLSADVNFDGEITVTDALLVLQFAVGKIKNF